jgi:hypothetical protein
MLTKLHRPTRGTANYIKKEALNKIENKIKSKNIKIILGGGSDGAGTPSLFVCCFLSVWDLGVCVYSVWLLLNQEK